MCCNYIKTPENYIMRVIPENCTQSAITIVCFQYQRKSENYLIASSAGSCGWWFYWLKILIMPILRMTRISMYYAFNRLWSKYSKMHIRAERSLNSLKKRSNKFLWHLLFLINVSHREHEIMMCACACAFLCWSLIARPFNFTTRL